MISREDECGESGGGMSESFDLRVQADNGQWSSAQHYSSRQRRDDVAESREQVYGQFILIRDDTNEEWRDWSFEYDLRIRDLFNEEGIV